MLFLVLFITLCRANFTIVCPPDYQGTIEDSAHEIFELLPTVIGLGCNDTEPVIAIERAQDPIYTKRSTRMMMNAEVSLNGMSFPCQADVHMQMAVSEEYNDLIDMNAKRSIVTFPDNKAKAMSHYNVEGMRNQPRIGLSLVMLMIVLMKVYLQS